MKTWMSIRRVRIGLFLLAAVLPAWLAQADSSTAMSPDFVVDLTEPPPPPVGSSTAMSPSFALDLTVQPPPGGSKTGMSPAFVVDLTGQPAPDLAVENVRFTPASVSIGGAVTVSFRARNLSGRAAVSPVARVRLSSGSALTESDPGLLPLDVTLPTLTAGMAYDYSGSFTTVPGTLPPGGYYVGVRIDPMNQLGQINTGNDVAVSAARLSVLGTGGPSLAVLPVARTVNAEASSTTFSIYNAGGGTMPWTAVSGAAWLHLGAGSSAGTGSGVAAVTYAANTLTSPRTGTITFSAPGASPPSVAVTVTQPGAAVQPPPVTTFQFASISSPQNVNSPFAVTVHAMNGAVVQTGFNGEIQLSTESGGRVTLRTIQLVDGAWTGSLSLTTAALQERLKATAMTGTRLESWSEPFQVLGTTSSISTITIVVASVVGYPVSGATVLLWRGGETPMTSDSGWDGATTFSVSGGGVFNVVARKGSLASACDQVNFQGTWEPKTVRLLASGRPVILVPGILGSTCDFNGASYPRLRGTPYAKRDSLKLYNPFGILGWGGLKSKLTAAGFAVFEAPWDWRMPVIRPDGEHVAWKDYLLPVIACAKAATGATSVDIVAHSMGGLLTRAYLQSPEYAKARDIDRFAMVGTPNEGSANAYYLWFGGDTTSQKVLEYYDGASADNYEAWTGGKWGENEPSQQDRLRFFRQNFKSLEELLPVYADALAYGDGAGMPYPGVESNPLYQLNHPSLGDLNQFYTADKVYAKVFYSTSTDTIRQIRLTPICSAGGIYPHGRPAGDPDKVKGDGTVTRLSATMDPSPATMDPSPFTWIGDASGGEHPYLVGRFADEIQKFLTEGRSMSSGASAKGSGPVPNLNTNQLLITVSGRSQPWVEDPQQAGAGISPLSGSYSNAWGQAMIEVDAWSAAFLRDDPPVGIYSGRLAAYPGEKIQLTAASSLASNTVMAELQWIGTTNEIRFGLQLAASGSSALVLVTELPAPQKLWSFPSGGACGLAWEALTNANVAAYRIYARRQDESLFSALGTVTNPPFSTGHAWATSASGTNWFYAVVAVSTSGAESPYEDTVMNYVPTLAKFTADVVSGTPPLSVAFADHSTGGVTNWSWDFNSDGNPDSTEQNPVVTFAQPGTYTVTLTVSGPNGEDTRVSVGYIYVALPSLSAIRLLPSQSVELELTGQPGRSYDIQVSTDLVAWAFLTNIIPTESVTTFSDTTAASQSARFYRAVVP